MTPKSSAEMRIRVILFAVLRDAVGAAETVLELPKSSTAAQAGAVLLERFPTLRPYLPRVAFAINRNYCRPDAELKEGDELALIPPVSGG